jgi:hypothetical protein
MSSHGVLELEHESPRVGPIIGNFAQGGRGGSGADGLDGWGGGAFVGSGGTAAFDEALIWLNAARGGEERWGEDDGAGIGGGLYVATGAVVTLKKTTVARNFPWTGVGDIYGTVAYLGVPRPSSLSGRPPIGRTIGARGEGRAGGSRIARPNAAFNPRSDDDPHDREARRPGMSEVSHEEK